MDIIEKTPDFVIACKPVGVDSETEFPQSLQKELGGEMYPIHRLDKNVAGLMVYARTKAAAGELSRTVQQGSMVKEYVALVHGLVPERGDWQDLLWKDSRKNKVFVVKRPRAGVKAARLEFTRLAATEEASLVRIRLHTGRSHQIRVQFSSRGFPLVGDHKYGARDKETAPRLFSCALTFPFRGRQCRYTLLPPWAEV